MQEAMPPYIHPCILTRRGVSTYLLEPHVALNYYRILLCSRSS